LLKQKPIMTSSTLAFTPLALDDQTAINQHTAQFAPYSDFNFTSLFCWNTDDSTQVAWHNNNLIVMLPDYVTGEPIYSVLGTNKVDETLSVVLQQTDKISMTPAASLVAASLDHYRISADTGNFDYIYKLDELATLAGGIYKKKRNKLHAVVRDLEQRTLATQTTTDIRAHEAAIRDIYQQWKAVSTQSEEELAAEAIAIDRLLTNIEHFDLLLTEVLLDGEPVAFSINEALPNGYALCHFEKALVRHHEQLYTYLIVAAAQALHNVGCRLVNWEQDLGIPGIRQAKKSYHPVQLLEKFTVYPQPVTQTHDIVAA
jgi:uncharacterized protein